MYHPLYPVARRLVGRRVNAYHVNGTVYCGVLQSVTQHGVFMSPCVPAARMIHAESPALEGMHAIQQAEAGAEFTPAYSPGGYFAFGALTGFTLGALAWW